MIPGPMTTLLQKRASGRLTDVLLLQQQRRGGQHPNPQRGRGRGRSHQAHGKHSGGLRLSSWGWKEDKTGMEDVAQMVVVDARRENA